MQLLVEGDLRQAANEDRGANRDDDQGHHGGTARGLDGELVERDPDRRRHENGKDRGQRQRNARLIGKDGDHAAEHDEFALGEVHDIGCVVDDGEAEGHQRVNRTDRHPGQQKLHELGHGCLPLHRA